MKRTFSRRSYAFTLVEMMIAMAVLLILLLMVTQLLTNAVNISEYQKKQMDAEDQARLVFSRMELDLSKMVKRDDLDSIFAQNTGNDGFYFYSEAPSIYDSSCSAYQASGGNPLTKNSVSLIGYRINSQFQLERLGKALNLDGGSTSAPPFLTFLTFPAGSSVPNTSSTIHGAWSGTVGTGGVSGTTQLTCSGFTNGTDPDYHVLSSEVFRMEVCLQLTNGTYALTHTSRDFSDVSSVIVTLAVLDTRSRGMVSSSALNGDLNQTVGLFTDASLANLQPGAGAPILPDQSWTSVLNQSSSFAASSRLPVAVARQVKVFQHYFYLD